MKRQNQFRAEETRNIMTENHRWKTILKYTAGLLALGLTLAVAMFLPEVYTAWQDEQMMDSVTLSNRESISFLDVDSIDIAGRLQMLQEAGSISFGEINYYMLALEDDIRRKMGELLLKWCDAGLLPESARRWGNSNYDESLLALVPYGVYVDQTILPVMIGRFASEDYSNMVTVVMDMEKDILYYVSVSGEEAMDEIAVELGYASNEDMQNQFEAGTRETEARAGDDNTTMDFASVCGAQDAEISNSGNTLEKDVTLKFEDFDGHAYRRLVSSECGFGYAIMYGTHRWSGLLEQLSDMYGFVEYEWATKEYFALLEKTAVEEKYSDVKNGEIIE